MTAGLAPCRKISSGNPPTPLRPALSWNYGAIRRGRCCRAIPDHTRHERARQWRRTAWALAALFATLPIACKIFVGTWGFDEAFDAAGLCAVLGTYFHILSRRSLPAVPDDATMLDRGIRSGSRG